MCFVRSRGRYLTRVRLAGAAMPGPRDACFIAGLIEAEGSFAIQPTNGGQNWLCSLNIALRDDERAPTVHEFLAWRAAHESRLPALSTLYRIFPDSWASVLDRAGVAVHVEGDRQEEVSTD
jgi:hypothetical protein